MIPFSAGGDSPSGGEFECDEEMLVDTAAGGDAAAFAAVFAAAFAFGVTAICN